MKRKTIRSILFALLIIGIIISIFSSFDGIHVIGLGMHNLDFGQNINTINLRNNITLIDVGLDLKVRTGSQLYMVGLYQLNYGIIQTIISVFLLGLLLGLLIIFIKNGK